MRFVQIYFGFIGFTLTLALCNPSPDNPGISENKDGSWSMQMGSARLLVDPTDGAKDISLLIGNTEFLTGKNVRKEFYGSSLWIAPQGRFWPQPEVLDFGPYDVAPFRNGILCVSQQDEHGLRYQKEITIDPAEQAFIHKYTISNQSDSSILLAAWEVTRHPKKGLSLFPHGDTSAEGTRYLDATIPMTVKDGMVWHAYDLSQKGHPGKGSKAFIDGREGWIAYVYGGYAVVKVFEDVPPRNSLPGEQDVEIYVDSRFDYIEIEVLSEKTALTPGESMEWQVEWRILELPADLDISPGTPDLPIFIQSRLP